MAQNSSIEWTEATWNPVTGCTKISAGCDNCYAERFAERFRGVKGHPYEGGFDLTLRPERLDQPLKWRRPRMIFVNSMSDLFHESVPASFIRRVWRVIEQADQHTYQILTKRPERMRRVAKRSALKVLPHVWLGTSVENQDYLSRIDHLRETPASVRFVSFEPLLGPMGTVDLSGIDWAIVGGESGPRARPMETAWVEEIQETCRRYGTAFFFKQWGGRNKKKAGRELKGRTWDDYPAAAPAPA